MSGIKRERKMDKKATRASSRQDNFRFLGSKRSQVTIFIILAILIVAVLIILFYPQIKKYTNPLLSIEVDTKTCFEKNVKEALSETLLHGGSVNPELYFNYENVSLNYLCYTSEWYKTCIMQNPLLKDSIENEIDGLVQTKLMSCINEIENKLKSRGYDVKITGARNVLIQIQPKKIVLIPNFEMTVKKEETTQVYSSNVLKTEISSGSYDLIMIASSIQNFEARYGDVTPESFMVIYPNIKVEKKKQSDGTKVYILTDRLSKEKLQFATRSLAWPPGYLI